jgi:carbonic anhydrase
MNILVDSFHWLVVVSIVNANGDYPQHWNYDAYGPDVWFERYPSCAGHLQSPIDIRTACTIYKNIDPFIFALGYNEQHNFTLRNNGHTIIGTYNNESRLSAFRLSGGDLDGTFEFVNFHLHWGENHRTGSEHEVYAKSNCIRHVFHLRCCCCCC